MFFAIHCIDKPGVAAKRADAMPKHVAYLDKAPIKNLMSGPLTSDDGTSIIGSLYVVEAENRQQIDTFLQNDPLVQADVWQSINIHAFNKRVDNRE